jgi:PAS domain S-box-containing protein
MKRSQVLDVLAAIAGMLSRGSSIDFEATMRLIGQAVGVDRMYLFENGVDPETGAAVCSQRFEWADGSVSAEIDNPVLQNLPYDSVSDVLEETLRRGDVFSGITRELGAKSRAILEPQGILSICLVPVTFDGELCGIVGFDDCHTERVWTDEEISILRLIAAIVGGYYSREQMQAALARSESQYQYIVDNVHEVIFECDARARILFVNRAWETLLGYGVDECVGHRIFDFIVPEARDRALDDAALAVASGVEEHWQEARFVGRDGEERWMRMVCRFRRDERGELTGVLGTMVDITVRRWAEEMLRRRQLDESLSTLAGGIAHDFNNVLHGILTAASVLARRHGGDPATSELVSVIQTSGERMADMTGQLLAYARGGVYETALLDPAQLVDDALKIGRARVPPNVRLEVRSSLPESQVEGDRGQLFQVVLNLVVNAVEAMRQGGALRIAIDGVELGPCDGLVRERVIARGSYVRLSFTDEGEGIAADALPRIFEPFFSTKAQGRGLGLAAARGVVASHGGTVTVESELGRGSTFHVLLPRRDGAAAAQEPEPAGEGGRSGVVLVVDDEEAILRVTSESLEEAGYRVLVARGGREAIEVFDRHTLEIDAVLVDYLMPDMLGSDVIRELRERAPDLRVVLCTGYDRDEAPTTVLEDVPRLEKPFAMSALLAALDEP